MARGATRFSRSAVLAYRAFVSELHEPAATTTRCAVLEIGVQDTPPGGPAPLALRARARSGPIAPYDEPELALVHSVRGTMHLHRAADLDLLAAALRPDDATDLLLSANGAFFREAAAAGVPVGAALDAVAAAMARVMSDGRARGKGDLSSAVTPLVPEAVAPFCPGCRVHHVHDGLFRMATLQARLRLRPAGGGSAEFLPPPGRPADVDAAAARRELVRRFLRHCGPADHKVLGAWLGLAPAAARRWFDLVADELVPVDVDGRRWFAHGGDLTALAEVPRPTGVHLLPPYDPLTEVADRPLLVADPARRRQVWRAVANPGVLLIAGEIAGTWRQRTAGKRPTVTVTAFERLSEARRRAVIRAAAALGGDDGPGEPEVVVEVAAPTGAAPVKRSPTQQPGRRSTR